MRRSTYRRPNPFRSWHVRVIAQHITAALGAGILASAVVFGPIIAQILLGL